MRLDFRDVATPIPQASAAKLLLHEAAQKNQPDVDGGPKTVIAEGLYEIDVCSTTPWYGAYRDAFSQGLPPLEHGFTRHYLACLFLVSSSHKAPQQQLQQVIQIQLNRSHNSKWFFADVAQYYVLVHDGSTGDNPIAEATFLSMKNLYGQSNCHMLTIKSVTPSNPSQDNDIWTPLMDCAINTENGIPPVKIKTNGIRSIRDHTLNPLSPVANSLDEPSSPTEVEKRGAWLTTPDRENINTFVSNSAPHCQLKNLSEQVAVKKGIDQSITNLTKCFSAGSGLTNILASTKNFVPMPVMMLQLVIVSLIAPPTAAEAGVFGILLDYGLKNESRTQIALLGTSIAVGDNCREVSLCSKYEMQQFVYSNVSKPIKPARGLFQCVEREHETTMLFVVDDPNLVYAEKDYQIILSYELLDTDHGYTLHNFDGVKVFTTKRLHSLEHCKAGDYIIFVLSREETTNPPLGNSCTSKLPRIAFYPPARLPQKKTEKKVEQQTETKTTGEIYQCMMPAKNESEDMMRAAENFVSGARRIRDASGVVSFMKKFLP